MSVSFCPTGLRISNMAEATGSANLLSDHSQTLPEEFGLKYINIRSIEIMAWNFISLNIFFLATRATA